MKKTKSTNEKPTISVRLPLTEIENIKNTATGLNLNVSQFIRDAIKKEVDQHSNAKAH